MRKQINKWSDLSWSDMDCHEIEWNEIPRARLRPREFRISWTNPGAPYSERALDRLHVWAKRNDMKLSEDGITWHEIKFVSEWSDMT